jgi:sugar lactone lactonase YvrE
MRFSAGFTGWAELPCDVADISDLTKFCLSDGIVDAKGRLYVGDIGYDFMDPAAKPVETCVIVLVEPDGRASEVADTLFFPNGMVITPDERTLIVGETLGHRLTAFDIREDGSLHNRWVWSQLPPSVGPHGICLDAERAVWCANPEGTDDVVCVREGGEITDRISGGHSCLRGDVGRARTPAPLHLCLRLP